MEGWGGGGGGGERGPCPPLEIGKKMLSEEILTSFTYVLLVKLGGSTSTAYIQKNGRGWADRRLSMVGGGGGRGGLVPSPLENEKKRLLEDILTSFTYVLLMKLGGGGSIHYTCKMEGGGRTSACPWWEVVGARGPCPPPPPLENEKKESVRGNFNLFHICFTNEIRGGSTSTAYIQKNGRGWADRRLSMVGGGGGRGGLVPSPLENEKKRLLEEILTSFTYVLLMKLGGGSIHYTCKMEGGVPNKRLSMVGGGGGEGSLPPPPRK